MQKWEYLLLENGVAIYYLNGVEHEWAGEPMYRLLNRLGQQGWQLVYGNERTPLSGAVLVFKRPVSDDLPGGSSGS